MDVVVDVSVDVDLDVVATFDAVTATTSQSCEVTHFSVEAAVDPSKLETRSTSTSTSRSTSTSKSATD